MAVRRRERSLGEKATPVGKALQHLADAALLPDERPEFERPKRPRDVSALSDDQLMQLFSELTEWIVYAHGSAARYAVQEKAAQKNLDEEEARFLVNNWGAQDKVTVARAHRDASPDVIKLQDELLEAYTRRKVTDSIVFGLDASITLVSRELTRRTGNPSTGRAFRYQN
jgi:hypothetical protein